MIDPKSSRAECEITIRNELGLHARPAAVFVKQANAFRSEIWIVTAVGRYDALSLLDVMRANLNRGAIARLEAVGVDAEKAIARLVEVVGQLRDTYD